MTRKTKIVATIGPTSQGQGVLEDLFASGVSVTRINMSHGSIDEHLAKIQAIREASARCGVDVAILADLPGPKIRAGRFPETGADLKVGDLWEVFPDVEESKERELHVDYETLLDDVCVGDRIVLGDGAMAFMTEEVKSDRLVVRVLSGGKAQGAPGVHLAVKRMTLRTPTPVDLVLADRVCAAGVDYVAVSFVCSSSDLDPMVSVVDGRAKIVAKIETKSAMCDLEAIAQKADAVMVARGDLGLDCPIEDVPHLQKEIIATCRRFRTPVITATQMLESMIYSTTPTRAEVSDVANAVFDGTDALMLSGETAVGFDPVNVVSTMSRIACRAEASAPKCVDAGPSADIAHALAASAGTLASATGASLIVCVTEHGNTATAIAAERPDVPLLSLSPDPKVARQLNLLRGTTAAEMPEFSSTDEMVSAAIATASALEMASPGDLVIVVAGAGDVIRVLHV